MPKPPIFLSRFIAPSMSLCILRSLLTSCTLVPLPLAMRILRLALITSGRARSLAVIDDIIASSRTSALSSSIPGFASPFIPGIMLARAPNPPIRCIWLICIRKSSRSNLPLAILAASFSASSTWIVSAARSTSPTTSPMPRMRPATRLG